jgi:hypothetical protein
MTSTTLKGYMSHGLQYPYTNWRIRACLAPSPTKNGKDAMHTKLLDRVTVKKGTPRDRLQLQLQEGQANAPPAISLRVGEWISKISLALIHATLQIAAWHFASARDMLLRPVRWLHVSSDAAACGAVVSRLTRFLLVLHRRRHRRRREKRSYLLPLSGEGVNDNGIVASACAVALVMESRVREATGDFVMECIFNYLGVRSKRAIQLTQWLVRSWSIKPWQGRVNKCVNPTRLMHGCPTSLKLCEHYMHDFQRARCMHLNFRLVI